MYELLVAQPRLGKQKEGLSEVRKSGFVPAVVFGKDLPSSLSIKIQAADLLRILSKDTQIFELKIGEGKRYLVHVENIQRDALKGSILHLSLKTIKKGERTVATVSVVLLGTSAENDCEIIIEQSVIDVQGLPQDIPQSIPVDISSLRSGDVIKLGELKLPVGVKAVSTDRDMIVVRCENVQKE